MLLLMLVEFTADVGDKTVYGSACFRHPDGPGEWVLLPLQIHAGVREILEPLMADGAKLHGFEVNAEPCQVTDRNAANAAKALSTPPDSKGRWQVEVAEASVFASGLSRRDRWGVK